MTVKRRNKTAHHYVENHKMYEALKEYRVECDKVEKAWNKKYGRKKKKLLSQGVKPKKIFDYLPAIEWPRVSEYLGLCMYEIATRSNNAPNFCSYTYKDEMIADGYEDCILRIRSFDVYQAGYKLYFIDNENNGKTKLMDLSTKDPEEVSEFIRNYNGDKISAKEIVKKIGLDFSVELIYTNWKIKADRNPFSYFTQACYYASVRRIKKEKKQRTVKSEMIKNSGIISEMESNTQSADTGTYANNYLNFLLDNVDQDKKDVNPDEKKKKPFKRTTKAHQKKLRDLEEQERLEIERDERLSKEFDRQDTEELLEIRVDSYHDDED